MKIHWAGLIVVAVLCIAMDAYICRRLWRTGYRWAAWLNGLLAVTAAGLVAAVCAMPIHEADAPLGTVVVAQYMLYGFFCLLAPKVLALPLYAVGHWLKQRWLTMAAFTVAALVLAVMLWGVLVTPHKLEVREVEMAFDDLPEAFDGYRIVQWSDAHLGTCNGDMADVENIVNTINGLDADMICFTGDLVSRVTAEAEPYRNLLARLHARDGVYSVLGNHDYDDYVHWDSEAAKLADRKALCDLQTAAGWKLLNNGYTVVKRGTQQIVLIGTENYGDHIGDKRGNIASAYGSARDGNFKILLQHNPYAWRAHVVPNSNIDLTLAGHTHAWQMMLSLGNWRWSPAAIRYPEWGGVYSEGKQRLYVNIGTGMVGTPMRIGATPEITLITLKKKRN